MQARMSFLTLLTMRAAFIAEDYFDADYISAACRPEYQAVFRRLSGCVNWAPPRRFPHFTKLNALMGHDCKANAALMRARYPYRSTTPELQRSLFGRSSNVTHDLHAELTSGRRERVLDGRQHSAMSAAYVSSVGSLNNPAVA